MTASDEFVLKLRANGCAAVRYECGCVVVPPKGEVAPVACPSSVGFPSHEQISELRRLLDAEVTA